jgi:hypothetical protein
VSGLSIFLIAMLFSNTAGLIWGVTLVRDTRGTATKTVARVRRLEAKHRMTHAEAINSPQAARWQGWQYIAFGVVMDAALMYTLIKTW